MVYNVHACLHKSVTTEMFERGLIIDSPYFFLFLTDCVVRGSVRIVTGREVSEFCLSDITATLKVAE